MTSLIFDHFAIILTTNMKARLFRRVPYPGLCHLIPNDYQVQCKLWRPEKDVPIFPVLPCLILSFTSFIKHTCEINEIKVLKIIITK